MLARFCSERGRSYARSLSGDIAPLPVVHSLSVDLRDRLRALVQEHVAPRAEQVDRDGAWPAEGMRALLDAGFGGLVAPREVDGLGYRLRGLIEACEIIAHACSSTALCFGMHCVGTAVLAAKATEYHKETFLRPIARGEHLTTLALSELGTGSHFYFPMAEIRHDGDKGFRLKGSKSFVTNGGFADSYVVSTVSTEHDQIAGEFSCVLVREGTEGMKWGGPWLGLGMRGNSSRTLELDNVPVPPEHLLGEEGDQIWYFFHVVTPYFLAAMAGTYLGIAGEAFNEARRHLQNRSYGHSGQRLSEIPIVQHRLGTIWASVERTRQLVYFAASEGDAGGPAALPALASAKAEVADCSIAVVNEVMTLAGGRAYSDGSKLGRMLRDARAAHVMAPTTDMLRTWTGRALLGQPILSD